MVALTARFTLLAALSSLAVVSFVDGAAVPLRPDTKSPSSASSKQTPLQPLVMPLPPSRQVKSSKAKKSTKKSEKGMNYHRDQNLAQAWESKRRSDLTASDWPSFKTKRHHHRPGYGEVVINGNDDNVHLWRRDHHDHHDRYRDGQVIEIAGNNDNVSVRRRSVLVVPDNNGGSHLISSKPHKRKRMVSMGDTQFGRRDFEEIQGSLCIYNETDKLGNLIVNPDNSIMASAAPSTPVIMLVNPGNDSVREAMIQATGSNQSPTNLCATYNPCPGEANMLAMEPCYSDPSTSAKSQIFMWNSTSGEVNPVGAGNCTNTNGGGGSDDSQDQDPTTTSSTTASPTSTGYSPNDTGLSSRDMSAQSPQGVALVFSPSSDSSIDSGSDADQGDSQGSSVTTSTVTATSTISSTETDIVTTTVTRMAAVMDITGTPSASGMGSSGVPSSQSTTGSQPTATTNDSQVTSTASSLGAPEPTALDVEVVSPSDPSPAPSTSDPAATSTASTSSVNAEAVASSIAASWSSTTTSATPTATDSSALTSPSSAGLYQRGFNRFMSDRL